jgi:hypothetical protein
MMLMQFTHLIGSGYSFSAHAASAVSYLMIAIPAAVGLFAILFYIRGLSRPKLVYSVSATMEIARPRILAGSQNAYRTSFAFRNSGWRAISVDMFTDQKPMTVNLGVPVDNASAETLPVEMPTPNPVINGATVEIGPLALAPGQVVTISIVTEGRPGHVDIKVPLHEVPVRKHRWPL